MTERPRPLKENGPPPNAPHFVSTETGRHEEVMGHWQDDPKGLVYYLYEDEDGHQQVSSMPRADFEVLLAKDA